MPAGYNGVVSFEVLIMRMAFGLAGVLVALGVLILFMRSVLDKEAAVINAGTQAREQVKQIGGYSQDMTPAAYSVTLEAQKSGTKLDSLLVVKLVPGGAMDQHFGLRRGDAIVEIGQAGSLVKMRDIPNQDEELAKIWVTEAFQKQQPLVVIRDDQRLVLPLQPAPGAAAPAPAPAPQQQPHQSPLSRQLEAIEKAGSQRDAIESN